MVPQCDSHHLDAPVHPGRGGTLGDLVVRRFLAGGGPPWRTGRPCPARSRPRVHFSREASPAR
eukprot:173453-Pyramimonas_sp.AAC.1